MRRLVGDFAGEKDLGRSGWPALRRLRLFEAPMPPRCWQGLTPPPRPCPLSFFYVKCSTAVMHACTRVYAEQRPAAPSGHAQPSGRRYAVNQSINPAVMQDAILPSPQVQYYVSEHSIKRLVSSRLACMRPHEITHRCQRITAAVVEWRPVQHPLPPSPTAKK